MLAKDLTVGTRITENGTGIDYTIKTFPLVNDECTKFLAADDSGKRKGFVFDNDDEVIIA